MGEGVSPPVRNYIGFTSPEVQTATVAAGGETVISYYYVRNRYSLKLESGEGISGISGDGDYYYGERVPLTACLLYTSIGDYVDLDIGNMTFQPADASSTFIRFREGSKLRRMKMIGATLIGGKSEIGSNVLTSDGFIYVTNCIEQGYSRGSMPSEGNRVKYSSGNLTI